VTTILKLGGSVITEKGRVETVDGDALERAADAIAGAVGGGSPGNATGGSGDLVVVHGGGSFGHHHADRHGVTPTRGTTDPGAVMDIHGAMTTLNRFVLRRLHDRDVPALPVHPLSAGARDAAGDLELPTGQVETMLGEGFLPVLHGDGVAHAGEGVTVLSGDEITVELAVALGAERVGLCSTVPGVLDAEGRPIDRIGDFASVREALGGSDATDVTGGMAGKVRAFLGVDTPAQVFGPDDLGAFLEGARPGTRIE